MQKKNAGIARNFALKGLLLLAALTLSTGFFACKVAVGSGEEAPQVTLTFDAGEGSFKDGKTLTLTGKAGENLALPEPPVRKGYDLTGWNPALPEKYPEKDTKYTAVWGTEGDYTITYVNVDGATNENPESYNVETETITLKDPVKTGYTFEGWYRTEDFTGEAVTEIVQGTTGNITLYAKWEPVSYTITYELDGGTNASENPAITLKDPVKTGYTFAGWYMAEDFTGNAVTEIVQGSTGNITLYAKWVKEGDYIITYVNVDGATNENPASYNVETETITLKDPVKTGYTFGGWYKDGGFTTKVTEITQGTTGNITLYAKWKLVSYTITYELYDGTNAPENPAGYNVETETITLKDPVKPGYTFAGWYKDAKFTTQVTEIIQGTTGDITLYAKWIEIIVPETLEVKGGNCTLNGTEVTLSSFWISKYEVTQEEFVSLMTGNQNGINANPSYFQGDTEPPAEGEVQERRPVEQVNWYDAIVYCNLLSIRNGLTPCYTIKGSTDPALWGTSPTSTGAEDYDEWKSVTCNFDADGYRLPTEAEWEYAARGGKPGMTDSSWNYDYSGSDTIDDVAWYNSNSDSKTHEVGKKQANALGLYDMSGNVWEWCWDWYGSSSGYPSGTEDPAGPDAGSNRVLRGGSWYGGASGCTVSFRNFSYPYYRSGNRGSLGFRLVRCAQ